jgi:hypothetical protein
MDASISDSQFNEIVKKKVDMASKFLGDQSVKILPWIGSRYNESRCRILIIGESVWEDTETGQYRYPTEEAAIRVTEEGRWRKAGLRTVKNRDTGRDFPILGNFTSNLFRYMTGLNSAEARKIFCERQYIEQWEQWAFWDVIQKRLKTASALPTKSDWEEGEHALAHVVKYLKPHLVLGLSLRMGKFLGKAGPEKVNEPCFLFVHHPSARPSGIKCWEIYRCIYEAMKKRCDGGDPAFLRG